MISIIENQYLKEIMATEEIIYNDKGAGQSRVYQRYDLVPPVPLKAVATVLAEGAEKYGEWNWDGIDIESHLNHALRHIMEYLMGNVEDNDISDHLSHALCRLMFAHHVHTRDIDVQE